MALTELIGEARHNFLAYLQALEHRQARKTSFAYDCVYIVEGNCVILESKSITQTDRRLPVLGGRG